MQDALNHIFNKGLDTVSMRTSLLLNSETMYAHVTGLRAVEWGPRRQFSSYWPRAKRCHRRSGSPPVSRGCDKGMARE